MDTVLTFYRIDPVLQNGRSASRCDRSISSIQQKMQKQWSLVMNLENLVGQIPKLNEGIEGIMKTLGTFSRLTKSCRHQVLLLYRPWWPSDLTYDVTAVKYCMVCVRSQVRIPLRATILIAQSQKWLVIIVYHSSNHYVIMSFL